MLAVWIFSDLSFQECGLGGFALSDTGKSVCCSLAIVPSGKAAYIGLHTLDKYCVSKVTSDILFSMPKLQRRVTLSCLGFDESNCSDDFGVGHATKLHANGKTRLYLYSLVYELI